MPEAHEDSFAALAGIDVHYDRDPFAYGTRGRPYVFKCQKRLKKALEACFTELSAIIPSGKPELITSAGTIGDGANAHGQGLAFDLDGLFWGNSSLIMNDFFNQKYLYLGINAHLYTHFPQVLNFYYPRHHDHFHVDFNFAFRYRRESNAQTFFLQACLKYLFDENLGRHGQHRDGVDGVHGETTRLALARVMAGLPIKDKGGLENEKGWLKFLRIVRTRAFERVGHDVRPSTIDASTFSAVAGAIALDVEAFLGHSATVAATSAGAATGGVAASSTEMSPRANVARCVCGVLVANNKRCLATKPPSQIGYTNDNLWTEDGVAMVKCLRKKGYKITVDESDIVIHFNKPLDDFQNFLLGKIKPK